MRHIFDQKAPVLSGIITEYAQRTPERNAIKDGATEYSFGALEILSNNLAQRLVETYHVRKGQRILFIAEKASEIIVAVIATWKAGAVFVPVDRNNGANRTKFIIDNVSPAVIISSQELLTKFAEVIADIPTISYEFIRTMDKVNDSFTSKPEVVGDDIAIILHTSGSTGNPKGVVLEHKSVVAYFRAHNLLFLFDEECKNINYGPYHFDVSIQDTFLPLYFGAAVYVYRGMLISTIVINLLLKESATHVIAVSSVLALITGDKDEIQKLKGSGLKVCMTGGEICDTKLINKWLATLPDIRLYNGYGPTECNSLCMAYQIPVADYDRDALFPIGKPFDQMKVALIDGNMEEITENGKTGTLIVAGPQLMREYWNLPDHTEKAFFWLRGERYYITGDLAKRDDEGNYYFEGRNDSEVKIHGRRINLNEIRNCLLRIEDTDYAVVGTVAVNNTTSIYAYVYQSAEKKQLEQPYIIEFLRKTLPEYMIPKYVFVSSEIIKTSTNKINEQEIRKDVESKILAVTN